LLAWLAPYRGFTGSVVPLKNLQNRVEKEGERIGGKQWAGWSNHLRHSFCSYHYSAFRDKKATEDIMGHAKMGQLDRFYDHPLPQHVAQRYWEVLPPSES
jgi:site-specific recombinase XerC